MSGNRAPRPSIPEPRPHLLQAVRAFVRRASECPGVRRIALIGSLATDKPVPKDADLLLTIDGAMDLAPLARLGRRLKGESNQMNLSADVFLVDESQAYMGRICGYRECYPRALCRARNCGVRQHLNDDLDIVTLEPRLIRSPPVDLWPCVLRRIAPPADVEQLLLSHLESGS